MVTDSHCHLVKREFMPAHHWQEEARFLGENMGRIAGEIISSKQIEETVIAKLWDPDGEATIKRMDEAGIDRSVLLTEDLSMVEGEGEVDVVEQNRHIAEIAKRHPARFIYYPCIDPRRPGALGLFERCVKEWGARGLKFNPRSGMIPDDKTCDPFLKRLSNWKMVLIVHTGPAPPPKKSESGHPDRLKRILVDYPELTVLACHLGMNWWRELIDLGQGHKNLVTDFSGFQPTAKGTYGRFCHMLRRFINELGKDRVLFGTDAPFFEHIMTSKDFIQLIKDLPKKSPPEIPFSEDEVYAILQGNAERLWGYKH